MASRTLLPDAAGFYTAWTVGAGSRPTLAQTNDGDTSYAITAGNVRDSYAVDNLQPSDVTVNSVTAHAYTKRTTSGAGTTKLFTRYNSVNDDGTFFSHNLNNYTIHSEAFANAPGGGGWTPAIVDATEVGLLHGGGAAPGVRYTQIWLVVVTTESSGESFIVLLSQILPLLGAALPFSAMREIARAAWRIKTPGVGSGLILPSEYAEAWRALRDYRHPRYFVIVGCGA